MTHVQRMEARQLLSTYYVDPAGSDAGAGTAPEAAWQSVGRVNLADLEPGDAVLFKGGAVFGGTLRLDAADAGTPAAPVTVGSYGDGRATLSAAGNGDGIAVSNAAGIVIENLSVAAADRQSPATGNGVEFDNALAGDVKLEFVRLRNLSVSGFGNFGITVGGSRGKSGFRDVRVEYVEVFGNTVGGVETHGVFSASATGYANEDVYVGHASVHDNPGYAGSPNHVGDGIVLSDVDGVVIERSVAFNNGALNTHVGGPVGIWVWDVNDALIQHNESHHNRTNSTADGGGFDLDGGVTNSVMQYNYSHDNDGAGYGIFQFQGARPFYNNVVRYNVSENDGRKGNYAGIQFWNGNGSNGIRDVDVYNNTVFMSPSGRGTPRAIYFQTGTTNVRVRNNVFQTTGGVTIADVQAKHTGLLMQGNAYWASGFSFRLKYFSKIYSSLFAFRSRTGLERLNGVATGFDVNPRLTAPGAGGTVGNADLLESGLTAYRLRPTSPVLNKGLNLWTLFGTDPGRRDFYGTALPATRQASESFLYDVGAHAAA